MAAARIVEPGQVASGREQCLQLALLDQAGAVIAEPGERLPFRCELGDMSGLDGHLQVPVDPIAVDGVAGNALPQQLDAFEGEVPDGARVARPDEALERGLTLGDSGKHLAAVAPGGAPAHPLFFQQDHSEAPFGEVEGRGTARHPGAHYADIRLDGSGQGCGEGWDQRRGAVIAFGVTGKGLGHRRRIRVHAACGNKALKNM